MLFQQKNSNDVFHRTRRSKKQVYPSWWEFTRCRSTHDNLWLSLHSCISCIQTAVWIPVWRCFGGILLWKQCWVAYMRCSAYAGYCINHLIFLMISQLHYWIGGWWLSLRLNSLRVCSSYSPRAWSSGILSRSFWMLFQLLKPGKSTGVFSSFSTLSLYLLTQFFLFLQRIYLHTWLVTDG